MGSPRNITTHTSLILFLESTASSGSQKYFCLFYFIDTTSGSGEKGQDERKYLLINYYVPGTFINISLYSPQLSERDIKATS